MDEKKRALWVLFNPASSEYLSELSDLTNFGMESNIKHKEGGPLRIEKDSEDITKL